MPDNAKEAREAAIKVPDGAGSTPTPPKEPDGRIERIVHETRQLSDDLTEWMNLRVRLIQLDIEARIDEELDLVFSGVTVVAMFVVALLLASIGIAFVLGDALGEVSYGFAIMAVLFVIVAAVISRMSLRMASGFRSRWKEDRGERDTDLTKKE